MSGEPLLKTAIAHKSGLINSRKQDDIVYRYRGFQKAYQVLLKTAAANTNVETGKNTNTNRTKSRRDLIDAVDVLILQSKELSKSLNEYAKAMNTGSRGTMEQKDTLREYAFLFSEYATLLGTLKRANASGSRWTGTPLRPAQEYKHNVTRFRYTNRNGTKKRFEQFNDYRANAVALKVGEKSINMSRFLTLLRSVLDDEYATELTNAPNVGVGNLFGNTGGARRKTRKQH